MGAARERPRCSSRRRSLPPYSHKHFCSHRLHANPNTCKAVFSAWDLIGWSYYSRHTGSNDFFPTGNSLRRLTNLRNVSQAVEKSSWRSHQKHHVTYLKALAWFSKNAKKNGWKTKRHFIVWFFFLLLFSQPDAGYNEFYQMWGSKDGNSHLVTFFFVMRDCFKHWEREEKSGL